MPKTLCKIKKAARAGKKCSGFDISDATHMCRKCERVADSKKKLCKPIKLVTVE